jgi:hypothetical protein
LTLPLITASGAGEEVHPGLGEANLPVLTASGVGRRALKGAGTPELPLLEVFGLGGGAVLHQGDGEATLPIIVCVGTGSVVSPATEQTPAGRGGTRKAKRKYLVEIDGQEFAFDDINQALNLLQKAEALARQTAETQAEQTIQVALPKAIRLGKAEQVQVKVPEIHGSDELSKHLRESRDRIRQVYRDAALAAELRILMALEAEKDDEDAILLLM